MPKYQDPEFKPEATEVWSSVGLTALMIIVSTYAAWATASLGASATFHITHGIVSSWVALIGAGVSILTALLAWRGFGLNAVAAFLGSVSLNAAVFGGTNTYKFSFAVLLAMGWLIAAIHYTRIYYEHNPFLTYLALWALVFASSVSQSVFYRVLFDHSYPLVGVLLLKSSLFGLWGLTFLLAFPRKNKEYII